MDIFITSLDNPQKQLRASAGTGLHGTDIYLAAANIETKEYEDYFFSQSVHLTGTFGNNWKYACPLYTSLQKTWSLFNANQADVLNNSYRIGDDFSFSTENIVSFGVPEFYGSEQRLDFILSNKGAFCIRTGSLFGSEKFRSGKEVIWLCDSNDDKRRELFGEIYQLAAADPIQMSNPIFPGHNGLKCITRGNQNAYHQ
jgi:hypothetical protein